MCGIIGIVSRVPQINKEWLSLGRDSMMHRGPDDAGEWWSSDLRIGMAQRRLAINDLSPAGHQPMKDSSGFLTIVFNGEIYNFAELRVVLIDKGHRFISQSDTEVILAAYSEWGAECLSRFNGMFALAIYDARNKVLFMARDRAGEKPLFYHLSIGELRFASELKALLIDSSLPRKINAESLDCYLAMGYVPGNRCILEGFQKLPPAHALLFDLETGRSRIWRYWQLPEFNLNVSQQNEEDLVDVLDKLLEASVRRQLVADVPVGVLLSGGVDSSLVTAMAARVANRIKTFTIGFPGHKIQDETQHARLVSRFFGTDHIEIMAADLSTDLIPKLARQFDEPIVDSSMIPTCLVSQLVREHCTVALGGDGGDELFGGYSHYSRLIRMQGKVGLIPKKIRECLSTVGEIVIPEGTRGRNWIVNIGEDFDCGLPLINPLFGPSMRKHLLGSMPHSGLAAKSIMRDRVPRDPDIVQRATRMDFYNYLAEDILVKVDRASMLNSLEMRAPFLDYSLIEFAYQTVPIRFKVNKNNRKILLKRLAVRLLPPQFDRNRKQGFSIPLNAWLAGGSFRELFYQVLNDPSCIFDASAVKSLLRDQDNGFSNSERLFALVLFEMWRKEYNVKTW